MVDRRTRTASSLDSVARVANVVWVAKSLPASTARVVWVAKSLPSMLFRRARTVSSFASVARSTKLPATFLFLVETSSR
jgi:hypothetical protein